MSSDVVPYALRIAASSLHKARDPYIYHLFENDHWLQRHLSSPEHGLPGYAVDLSLAFESLRQDITTEVSDVAEPMQRLVQLCTVRSTLASSEDIPEKILLAAVRTGVWKGADAISMVARHADRDRQASVYVSMLQRADLEESQRRTTQQSLAALAFAAPEQMPAAELLRGIPLLERRDQRAVAERLALCPIAASGPRSLLESRSIGRTVLNAVDVVATILSTPESRRKPLVKKTIDTLISEAARITSRAALPYNGEPAAPAPWMTLRVPTRWRSFMATIRPAASSTGVGTGCGARGRIPGYRRSANKNYGVHGVCRNRSRMVRTLRRVCGQPKGGRRSMAAP